MAEMGSWPVMTIENIFELVAVTLFVALTFGAIEFYSSIGSNTAESHGLSASGGIAISNLNQPYSTEKKEALVRKSSTKRLPGQKTQQLAFKIQGEGKTPDSSKYEPPIRTMLYDPNRNRFYKIKIYQKHD